jgi:molybdenum cofactor cytidylyltransferase
MGRLGPKVLLPYRGRPLLDHIVRTALDSRLAEVIVVLGHDADRVRQALGGDARLRVVVNPDYAQGRASSIQSGLRAAGIGAPGVLFLLGDQPLMTAALIDAVIEAAEAEESRGSAGAPFVVTTLAPGGAARNEAERAQRNAAALAKRDVTSGRKGNPVLFRRSLFEKLDELRGDRGALDLIEALWDRAAHVAIDDARTQTRIETPEDYERLVAGDIAGDAASGGGASAASERKSGEQRD